MKVVLLGFFTCSVSVILGSVISLPARTKERELEFFIHKCNKTGIIPLTCAPKPHLVDGLCFVVLDYAIQLCNVTSQMKEVTPNTTALCPIKLLPIQHFKNQTEKLINSLSKEDSCKTECGSESGREICPKIFIAMSQLSKDKTDPSRPVTGDVAKDNTKNLPSDAKFQLTATSASENQLSQQEKLPDPPKGAPESLLPSIEKHESIASDKQPPAIQHSDTRPIPPESSTRGKASHSVSVPVITEVQKPVEPPKEAKDESNPDKKPADQPGASNLSPSKPTAEVKEDKNAAEPAANDYGAGMESRADALQPKPADVEKGDVGGEAEFELPREQDPDLEEENAGGGGAGDDDGNGGIELPDAANPLPKYLESQGGEELAKNGGKSAVTRLDQHSEAVIEITSNGPFQESPDSHFFFYFLSVVTISAVSYVAYHNKNKMLALVLEGRRGRQGRRRPNSAGYRKLDTSLEEAMMSHPSRGPAQHVIY